MRATLITAAALLLGGCVDPSTTLAPWATAQQALDDWLVDAGVRPRADWEAADPDCSIEASDAGGIGVSRLRVNCSPDTGV